MKKIFAIFFLLFFSLAQTGHYVMYYIQRWEIKNKVKEAIVAGMPNRYLEIVEYNDSIEWLEEGEEFKLKDNFYDVVSIKNKGTKKYLYCFNDKNEEQLVSNFAEAIKLSNDNEKGKTEKHIFRFYLTDQDIFYYISSVLIKHFALYNYFNHEVVLVTQCREVIIPPPWKYQPEFPHKIFVCSYGFKGRLSTYFY